MPVVEQVGVEVDVVIDKIFEVKVDVVINEDRKLVAKLMNTKLFLPAGRVTLNGS